MHWETNFYCRYIVNGQCVQTTCVVQLWCIHVHSSAAKANACALVGHVHRSQPRSLHTQDVPWSYRPMLSLKETSHAQAPTHGPDAAVRATRRSPLGSRSKPRHDSRAQAHAVTSQIDGSRRSAQRYRGGVAVPGGFFLDGLIAHLAAKQRCGEMRWPCAWCFGWRLGAGGGDGV